MVSIPYLTHVAITVCVGIMSMSSPIGFVKNFAQRGATSQLKFCFRWYGLAKRSTGVKQWERERLTRGEEPTDRFDLLCQSTVANVQRCRYAKASDVNKIFDSCVTVEQLAKAEEVLRSFRHGLTLPRASLPLVVARACIRVEKPEQMLQFVRDEVHYGVFPSRKVYNIIMDAMLKRKKPKSALSAFGHMMSQEVKPDGMSYFLATKAAYYYALKVLKSSRIQQGGDEGEEEQRELDLEHTLELCGKCSALEPKLGTKGYRFIVGALLREGMTDKANDLLNELEKNATIPQQSLLNLRFDVLLSKGALSGAVHMLSELCNDDNKRWHGVGAPQRGLPRLQEAIEQSQDDELKESFEKVKTSLETGKSSKS